MAGKFYNFKYKLEIPPYDRVVDVLEAFFVSYHGGDYTCEHREKYKLSFRRGEWKRTVSSFGMRVPDQLVKGQFNRWPLVIRVLARPSPESFSIAVHYELHLPETMKGLSQAVLDSVDAHARKELAELASYLAECVGISQPPEVIRQ
jgi:hypothetical protein